MPIPPEIDELMWGIAENDTPEAVYAFETRYPKYQGELLRRIKTVKALKEQGKAPPAEQSIPKFQARPVKPDSRPFLIAAVAAVAVSFGIIFTMLSIRPNPVVNAPAPQTTVVDNTPQSAPQNPIPQVEVQNQPPVNPAVEAAEKAMREQTAEPKLKLFDLQLSGAKLHDVIQLIGEGGGVTINIAPGLENPDVNVSYTQMTAMEMLKSLGKDYAFSAVIDGEKSILVLPVKEVVSDDNASNEVR